MCSVVGFNNSVDSDVSESSESEAAMSNSAQSYHSPQVSLPPPSSLQNLLQLHVDSDVSESSSLWLLSQILFRAVASFNTLNT